MNKKLGGQNEGNEEDVKTQDNKIKAKVYDPDSENELNGDFGMVENDDNSNTDN